MRSAGQIVCSITPGSQQTMGPMSRHSYKPQLVSFSQQNQVHRVLGAACTAEDRHCTWLRLGGTHHCSPAVKEGAQPRICCSPSTCTLPEHLPTALGVSQTDQRPRRVDLKPAMVGVAIPHRNEQTVQGIFLVAEENLSSTPLFAWILQLQPSHNIIPWLSGSKQNILGFDGLTNVSSSTSYPPCSSPGPPSHKPPYTCPPARAAATQGLSSHLLCLASFYNLSDLSSKANP